MTFVCVSPTALKKSITANASWGNGHTWHVLSDYDDEFILFCMPLENIVLQMNELAIEAARCLSCSV